MTTSPVVWQTTMRQCGERIYEFIRSQWGYFSGTFRIPIQLRTNLMPLTCSTQFVILIVNETSQRQKIKKKDVAAIQYYYIIIHVYCAHPFTNIL